MKRITDTCMKVYFHSDRFVFIRKLIYTKTREGYYLGPFKTMDEAKITLNRFLNAKQVTNNTSNGRLQPYQRLDQKQCG